MMIKHFAKVVDPSKGAHALPNGYLLSVLFEHYRVPLRADTKETRKDIFDKKDIVGV